MTSDILIVDDEADIRELVAGILQDEGHDTRTAGDSDKALSAVAERLPNLVFLDIWLRGSRLDGLQLLDCLKQQHPELPIVMMSGHSNKDCCLRQKTRRLRPYRKTFHNRPPDAGDGTRLGTGEDASAGAKLKRRTHFANARQAAGCRF
jgi:CheY-like chemotaxis protein